MKQIDVYTINGKKQGKMNIPKSLNIKVKLELIHQAYVYELSKKLKPTAHTKDRGEVRGSGRKPWRQKGTGRARVGSVRSPLWRGGGITFGPTPNKNFKKRIPNKQRKKAVLGVLAEKINNKKLIILSKLSLDKIKTKDLEGKLAKLPIDGTVLIILTKKDETISKSAKNLPYVKVTLFPKITITSLLNNDFIITTKSGLEKIAKL